MKNKERYIFDYILTVNGKTRKFAQDLLGISKQLISYKMRTNTFTTEELNKLKDVLDFDLSLIDNSRCIYYEPVEVTIKSNDLSFLIDTFLRSINNETERNNLSFLINELCFMFGREYIYLKVVNANKKNIEINRDNLLKGIFMDWFNYSDLIPRIIGHADFVKASYLNGMVFIPASTLEILQKHNNDVYKKIKTLSFILVE